MSSIRSCGLLIYDDNEHAKQLLYALNDHIWGMKITTLEESADFVTLKTEKLFSKLKSHKLSSKGRWNHATSFTSMALITSARVGGHDTNSTNTISSSLEFALSSLAAVSYEQYKSIPDGEIVLLARKFRALHKFCKERRRSPRGLLQVWWYYSLHHRLPQEEEVRLLQQVRLHQLEWLSNKGDNKKKNHLRDNNNKKKKFQKIMF
jgi:hypothetical protein